MNIGVTSKEAILKVCRKIASENGLTSLNMRLVADECNIALGTLYNYYSNKDDLLLATVESIWKDIFHMNNGCKKECTFTSFIKQIFECVQEGGKAYPNFFTEHSISISKVKKGKAKSTMDECFQHIKESMLEVLKEDSKVVQDIFTESFTEENFIDFIFNNMLYILMQGNIDCNMLIEIITRIIYE